MAASYPSKGSTKEDLTDQELESRVRGIEDLLRGLPEGSCLYQYARVMSGFDLPRQDTYNNAVTESFVRDRLAFLKEKAAFRRIDLSGVSRSSRGRPAHFSESQRTGRRELPNAEQS